MKRMCKHTQKIDKKWGKATRKLKEEWPLSYDNLF